MTANEMTDNEIIKFIEHAINSAKSEDGFKEIYWEKLAYILNFINRQKVIIEKSEKVEQFANKTIETANAEIEKLNIELQSMRNAANSYKMHYEKAQAKIEKLTLEIEEANEADRKSAIQALKESKENAKLFCEATNHIKSEAINEFEKEIKYVKENEKYDDFNPIVDIDLCEKVLNIMIRQNEKIKKLNIKNKELSILINMQEKNIKEQQIIIDTLKTLSESAKLEVIKDFETKLNEKKTQSTMDKCIYSAEMIDNILKEMADVEINHRKEDEGK